MSRKEHDKFLPENIFEGMTSISALLNAPPTAQNDRKILEVFIDEEKKKSKAREISYLEHKSRELGFPICFVTSDELDTMTVGNTHGGIVAKCTERSFPLLSASQDRIKSNGFYVYLEGIEDPYNFGYTVRSLYAAGVSGIILPERNWMGAAGIVARSSAGCSEKISVFVSDICSACDVFRDKKYKIAAAGIRDSVSLYDADLSFPLLLIVGGEKRGISRAALDMSDTVVRIEYSDQTGFGGSLSAASAATVLAFEVFRQNLKR